MNCQGCTAVGAKANWLTGRFAFRRFLSLCGWLICLTLLLRAFFLDVFHVPTGSMAPALVGNHRACECPRCGHEVLVGLHERDAGAAEVKESWYSKAWCTNCGFGRLPLQNAPFIPGPRFLVNKTAFTVRAPQRWEVVIMQLFGLNFIKRILGLPGESVEIRDGDLYVDGSLCRKSLAEFKKMRIPVFDINFQPRPMTWAARWECAPYKPDAPTLVGSALFLGDRETPDGWHLAAYRHFCLDTQKFLPIVDEYAYNGAQPARTVPVHDLMLECDIEIQQGQGEFALGITDGKDYALAKAPITNSATSGGPLGSSIHLVRAFSLPALQDPGPPIAEASGVSLQSGKRYHVEWAFVDRRLTLAIDGREVLGTIDLPPCFERGEVVRPVMLAVRGAKAKVTNLRLWRDVHYTQDGQHGVAGAVVHLGADQYFVLGDNSPRSEDSRFWPHDGAVPASALIGSPLFLPKPH
jgi:signal peptidase I